MPVVSSDTSPMLGQGWIVKLVVWMVPPVTLMNTREPSRGCFVTSHECMYLCIYVSTYSTLPAIRTPELETLALKLARGQ